jgi:arylsulfatase A
MGTVLFAGLVAGAGVAQPSRPANIVLIMADDIGYECIGAYGGTSYRTPNIDRLAETGARFEHCYSTPICTPSRVQIMTGMYNLFNYTRFAHLDRSQTTFAHVLKAHGYATCIAGKWQLGHEPDAPQHFGFDDALLWQHTRRNFSNAAGTDTRYVNPQLEHNAREADYSNGEYGPDLMGEFICRFIEAHKDEPFFVYYPMILPHAPFVPTPDSADWDPAGKGVPKGGGDVKYFGDMVAHMDKLVGVISDQLEASGLTDTTYVIFTADNGTLGTVVSRINGRDVRGGKGLMTDAGTRVPLVVRGPGVAKGAVCDDLVDFSDFLPTLCDIAGAAVPSEMNVNGRSFLPRLKGLEGHSRSYVYCWYPIPDFIGHFGSLKVQVFARNHRYKLYRTGEFHDLHHDVLEKNPLLPGDLSDEAARVKEELQAVIDEYETLSKGEGNHD